MAFATFHYGYNTRHDTMFTTSKKIWTYNTEFIFKKGSDD